MAPKPITTNTLFYGDNLPILREHIVDESVDLAYLDPPFNSNRSYNVLFKDEKGHEAESQIEAFDDTWHWNAHTEAVYDELITVTDGNVGLLVGALRQAIGNNQMMAYLVMMAARLVELHRVLKPTGSLYLHCDPTASHYLKILLDAIFGPETFRNEVIWQRTAAKGDARQKYGAVHDTILFYGKSSSADFNPVYVETNDDYLSRFRLDDKDGKGLYRLAPLDSPNPRPNLTYVYKGYQPPAKGWRVSRELMEQLDTEGRLNFPKDPNGRISRKHYLNEQEGRKASDVWTDIAPLQASAAERLGYPTQKPLALMERILAASSNENDLVLDCFAGCGTTIAAAQKMNRRWIGIDITELAIALQKYRLADMFPDAAFEIVGEPTDLQGAQQLAQDDRYQFQWWALSLIKARPLGGQSGSKAGKKGSDKGIDGILTFIADAAGKPGQILVQVKSGHVKSGDVRDLVGTLEREKASMGLFITLETPSKDMETEAATAGTYHSTHWGNFPKVQILTIEQLLHGQTFRTPPPFGTFKQAPKAETGKQGQQGELDLDA